MSETRYRDLTPASALGLDDIFSMTTGMPGAPASESATIKLLLDHIAESFRALLSMEKDPDAGFPDLGAGWTPVTNYDREIVARNMSSDLVAGTFTFERTGIYAISADFNIEHDDSNTGRTVNIRLLNVTDGVPVGSGVVLGIGRNQPATHFSITRTVLVSAANVGDTIRMEIGNGDTVSVSSLRAGIYLNRIDSETATDH